jgi:acyl transferase domain-containing protein/NADPH:quinone reductase-like Zn-dependent oxidoreductase/SAM-dependent methyltransferase/acyl carrier protein
MQRNDIAIIGIGCRFPGDINDTESFWRVLVEGKDVVGEIPADRWNVERFHDAEPGIAGKSIARRGGFISGLELFDPQFFGISPREAPYIDPQQRLLLETAWEAIEDAGLVLDTEAGTDVGVFAGISHTDYHNIQGGSSDRSRISAHSPTGTAHSIAANRISYCLNLKGPSLAVDTACSSALTAVHLACEHIRAKRCAMALAGGVTVMILPDGFIGFSQAGMLSPDGKCHAFSAEANGFVRAEGAGMVLLKPLSRALSDGDPIYAVILGSALNQDGHTNGISLPSAEAQASLIRNACLDAGVQPSQVGFVEAHGTGTAVGDPIEAMALSAALCEQRPTTEPLLIGSVKTNMGHLETAAGIAGLIKAALVVSHGTVPPNLNFKTPSRHIDFPNLKLRVPTTAEVFPQAGERRIAGVNSFGFGGANAHVILADAPPRTVAQQFDDSGNRGWPLVFSARSESALKAVAARMADWVERRSGHSKGLPLGALAHTLGARRNHHAHRFTLVAHSASQLVAALREFSTGISPIAVRAAFTPRLERPLRVVFAMSGQGPQWWGMGRELMRAEPVFRKTVEVCAEAMRPHARFSLLDELRRDGGASRLQQTEIAQPAIFAIQLAFAELWKSIGVMPAAVVGHSVGEIAAACVAGILSVEDAARVIVLRGRLMENCIAGNGAMLAVSLSEVEAAAVIERHDPSVTIAAFNGPTSLTLAGARDALEPIRAELEALKVFARFVPVNYAFHHAMMQPAADALKSELAALVPQDETTPFFSTLTGGRQKGQECGAMYWARGIRQPVRFAAAVNAIAEHGADMWIEIGSHPVLSLSIQECLALRGQKSAVIPSSRREREHDSFLEAALELHRSGMALDFKAWTPSSHLIPLPAYPWDKSHWWNESSATREARLGPGGKGFLDLRLPRAVPAWLTRLDTRHMAFLKDHKVDAHVIFPAAAFVDMVLEAGVQLFEGRPFVIEDFEIRKPLLLPESPSDVLLETSFDPEERTFAIKSRFEQSSSWSLHVVGGLRGERTTSVFAGSAFQGSHDGLQQKEIDRFYDHLTELGLRYGEHFQSVRELFTGARRSAGKVAICGQIADRVHEYAAHPVVLDGALQVFSAAARTSDEGPASLKLPVRFSRILFLRSPGTCCSVNASVLHSTANLVEGRIELYDGKGHPCVLIDGYRAIAMNGIRRAGSPANERDLIYHLEWLCLPATAPVSTLDPVPLPQLRGAAGEALDDVLALRGRGQLRAAMTAAERVAATQIAQGLCAMGVDASSRKTFTAESLGVALPLRLGFERLMSRLTTLGLLARQGAGYKPAAKLGKAAKSAPDVLRSFIEAYPGHVPDALLSALTGADLGNILTGEKDAVEVLFGPEGTGLLEHFYGDGLLVSSWTACIGGALEEAVRHLPEGRGLRILETGAGTGGLAAQLLPLLDRGLHSYTYTDVSPAFFPQAKQKLEAFPEVEYRVLDLDRPIPEQGFEPESYDFIVGSHVLHAVADVRASLKSLCDLLIPGGTLIFVDVATARLWTESIFGLTSGWWHLKDHDLRPDQPLLQRAQWESVLRECGFVETVSLEGLSGPEGGEVQVAVMARKGGSKSSNIERATDAEPIEDSWLVFADSAGLGSQIAADVEAAGARCRIVTKSAQPAGWIAQVDSMLRDEVPRRVVYLWTLDTGDEIDPLDASMGTADLLHLMHALEGAIPGQLRFDLVTRGAQAVGQDKSGPALAQAACIGMFRVIGNEYLQFACRSIDLPPIATASDYKLLWSELLYKDSEREIALRGEARYAQRITRGMPAREEKLDVSVPLRLECRDRGMLDSLRFSAFAPANPGPGKVLIKVAAAGVNFRDVLKGLGVYPADAEDADAFGDEVAGEVVAIGDGVQDLAPGDAVFGLAEFGLATHTLADASAIRPIPAGMTFEEAATIPVVFMTAWHSLTKVARLQKNETILIHAGAGGVGMAAIQIAQHVGARVIASAGSPAKRRLLRTIGVAQVIDSRHEDFAEAVMELTAGRGVDVVLNALASEAIPMGMSCLAEGGRFVEIGKRDIYQNSRVPLRPLRHNCSLHVVAMDAIFAGDERQARTLMAEVTRLLEKKRLRPLPFRSIPANRIPSAFRLMAAGKHIGKVVIPFAGAFIRRRGERPLPEFNVKADAAYLVTGGTSGYGRVVSEWLVESGARHLVLVSRNGAATQESQAFVEKLRNTGAAVRVIRANVGVQRDVEDLVREVRGGIPLKGIFHLAMVLDDAPLSQLTTERLHSVMAPKAVGAWLLHENTKDLDLDCFVLFSSASGIFGHQNQANYAAASVFLDALAHHRRGLGLPGMSVDWGPLGEEGYIARNPRIGEFLARQGNGALEPREVKRLLQSFLQNHTAQVAAIRLDWSRLRQALRGGEANPLLDRVGLKGMDPVEGGGGLCDWKLLIHAAAAGERDTVIVRAVRDVVGSVLRVKPDSLRDDQALTDLGLDSLMGVEIETMIETSIGATLPSRSLLRARTIGQIAMLVSEHVAVGGVSLQENKTQHIETAASISVDEIDLDLVSDEDIRRFVEGAASGEASLQDATR